MFGSRVAVENFTRDEAIRVVKDILMKYPRGPLQKQKKEEYTADWQDTYLKAVEIGNGAKSEGRWGYTDEQAYQCVLEVFGGGEPNHWRIRDALRELHPDWSAHKATRSANRFWSRMGHACKRHIGTMQVEKLYSFSGNTPAAFIPKNDHESYAVERRRRNNQNRVRVAVTASSQEEARMSAGALFGHALINLELHQTNDWKSSDEGDAVVQNNKTLEGIQAKREEIQRKMADLKGQLEEIEFAEEAIQMYNVTIFSGS